MIDCIVVDDDILTLKIVKSLIEKTSFLRLKGFFDDAIQAADFLRQEKVDLIFLDVEMPDMTGLELLEALETQPQIVLISSKEKYAIKAFQYEVTDYLLKPIENYSRFLKAAQRAKANIEKNTAPASQKNPDIYLKIDSLLVRFNLQGILWIEAYGDYVKVKTAPQVYVVYATLRSVEEALPASEFIRIHRSYIVRIDKIVNIDATNLQIEKKILPIGSSYRKKLLEKINTL
jgi:DNA-binding LytR/AlgR family response regulator